MSKSADDDLRDLNPEEAQELRDFLEKRRWFEGKLKLLEALPDIYPFMHPVLSQTNIGDQQPHDLTRQGEDSSPWQLPNINHVKDWQTERNRIEDEVLRFDGGDLGRMKEKTRAATLLPLTPPSTHLVSITLDLIVLIDRLLTLLRHRGQLLELVITRLRWDDLRWKIMLETLKIRQEVADIVQDKGRWQPVTETAGLGRSHITKTSDPAQTPPRTPNLSSAALDPDSTPKTILSPGASPRLNNTPKRSLHIPLLHSQLVNLNIRQQNLVSNQVKRSGILLDRIIDLAGPLKDLGGITSPSSGTASNGAVPDELLDIQDGLEAEVKEMGETVAWCKQLEQHWKLSEAHHASSLDALQHGQHIVQTLQSYLSQPASSAHHRELAQLLRDAQNRLPPPIDQSYPNPSHPAYPDNDLHNTQVLAALTETFDKAQRVLLDCHIGIDWFGKLVEARNVLVEQEKQIIAVHGQLQDAVDLLSKGDGVSHPPNFGEPTELTSTDDLWTKKADAWILETQKYREEGILISQKATLALMKYRNASKKIPLGLDCNLGNDHIMISMEEENEILVKLCESANTAIRTTQQSEKTLSLIHPLLRSVNIAQEDYTALEADISTATCQAAWPSCQGVDFPEIHGKVGRLDRQIEDEVQKPLQAVDADLREANLPKLEAYIKAKVSGIVDEQNRLHRSMEMVQKVHQQAIAVKSVDQDQIEFQGKVKTLQEKLERMHVDGNEVTDLADPIDALEGEYATWESSLAGRIPFLSDHPDTAPVPPPHISALHNKPFDAPTTDRAVRDHVNRSTLTIASAIASCKAAHERRVHEHWTRRCHEAAQRIDQVISDWQDIHNKAVKDIASLSSSGNSIQDLRGKLAPLLLQHKETSQAALSRLEEVVGERSDGPDTATWESTISPARIAVHRLLLEVEQLQVSLDDSILKVSDRVQPTGDVFGPILAESATDVILDPLRQLQQELQYLNIELMANPPSKINTTPRKLPSSNTARKTKLSLEAISRRTAKIDVAGHEATAARLTDLKQAIANDMTLLPRLNLLAQMNDTINACDNTFSTLLQAIDGGELNAAAMTAATESYQQVQDLSSQFTNDWRVMEEVKRLSRAWEELRVLAEGPSEVIRPTSAASTPTISRLPRLSSSIPRAINRSTSNPVSDKPKTVISPLVNLSQSVRNRAVSDTPSRVRLSSMNGTWPRQSSLPRPTRLSMPGRVASPPVKKEYVADPKSKLDVAIGKVVNKLNVHVPVRPVGLNTSEQWKDQSGQYWIGSEGRAKLCFCRILRSRTVMVRVGGGWVELSKFLFDHFADAVEAWQIPFDSPLIKRPTLSASSSSTSLSHFSKQLPPSVSSSSLASIASSRSDKTPVRKPIDLPQDHLSSDKLPKSLSNRSLTHPQTPGSTTRLLPTSPGGSPLSAFQFMRKASESPSLREKEKERFHGRRSILGKEESV